MGVENDLLELPCANAIYIGVKVRKGWQVREKKMWGVEERGVRRDWGILT